MKYVAQWAANGGILLGRALGLREHSSLARATRKVAEAHLRAIAAYRPKPYDGKIVQLMCSDASHRAYEDRRLAWSSLASEGLEVRIIPGDHLTMVEEPYAQVLAQELQICLDRAGWVADSGVRKSEEKQDRQDARQFAPVLPLQRFASPAADLSDDRKPQRQFVRAGRRS